MVYLYMYERGLVLCPGPWIYRNLQVLFFILILRINSEFLNLCGEFFGYVNNE